MSDSGDDLSEISIDEDPIMLDPSCRSYVRFITGSFLDGQGGYARPYEELKAEAKKEYVQVLPSFRARLHTVLEGAGPIDQKTNAVLEVLTSQIKASQGIWDSLPPALQASQRLHLTSCLDEFLQKTNNLHTYLASLFEECGRTIETDSQRVRQDFPSPLEMELLVSGIRRRGGMNINRINQVQNINSIRNPSQVLRQGDKIAGNYLLPHALHGHWKRQILPPVSTFTNIGWKSSDEALPQSDSLQWNGEHLGAGGMGATILYIQRDGNGTIRDRIVIKDSHVVNSEEEFRAPSYWHGNTSTDDWMTTCVPMEYHTQKLASDDRSMNNVVRIRGEPLVRWETFTFRHLMEYSPKGDLWKVIDRHQDHEEPIPEKFIWLTFQALARACVVLKRGGLNHQLDPWSEIVHMDLKPDNVFLGIADPQFYPQWPTPQLGDFGLAFVTSNNDITNPFVWSGAGTPGYLAPEQNQYIDSVTGQPVDHVRLLSPCNVYGVGVILYAMMEQRMLKHADQPSFLPGTPPDQYQFSPLSKALYSKDLCRLVEACLAFNPGNRPTVEQLKDYTTARLSSDAWKFDRSGVVGPFDDTLLLPDYLTKLKWASRMKNGPEGVNAQRQSRAPGDGTTDYSSEDESDMS